MALASRFVVAAETPSYVFSSNMTLDQEPELSEKDGPGGGQSDKPPQRTGSPPQTHLRSTPFGLPIASAEQRVGWHRSEERRRVIKAFTWVVAADLLAVTLVGLVRYIYVFKFSSSLFTSPIEAGLQASTLALGISLYPLVGFIFYRRTQFRLYRDRVELERAKVEVQDAESKLADRDSLHFDFPSLWGVTAKRLDYYHEIATQQANASFRRAQWAMGSGFAILLLSLITSLVAKTLVSSVTVAFIGGLSAALGGYIGRTFLRSQEAASEKLQGYFYQPLELSRILIAERLLQDLPEDRRAEGTLRIIEGIVRPPEAPAKGSPD
ncbi:hypothetical protein ACIBD9_24885 [Micromonospora sp. NPDC050784]|uniref:TRADD-N-associated membrane domain-containing protein n=1 Tax=Micromonospora sp. NPDC050784 TaxID=3364281 RepID=UPI0037A2B8F5